MQKPNPYPKPDTIRNEIKNIIGFTGLLLGLVINAILTIKFEKYETAFLIKLSFLVAMYCLTMCITSSIIAYQATIYPNRNNPEKLLNASSNWLIAGFLMIISTIVVILYPSKHLTIPFWFLIFTASTLIYESKKHENKTSQPLTETEERLT